VWWQELQIAMARRLLPWNGRLRALQVLLLLWSLRHGGRLQNNDLLLLWLLLLLLLLLLLPLLLLLRKSATRCGSGGRNEACRCHNELPRLHNTICIACEWTRSKGTLLQGQWGRLCSTEEKLSLLRQHLDHLCWGVPIRRHKGCWACLWQATRHC